MHPRAESEEPDSFTHSSQTQRPARPPKKNIQLPTPSARSKGKLPVENVAHGVGMGSSSTSMPGKLRGGHQHPGVSGVQKETHQADSMAPNRSLLIIRMLGTICNGSRLPLTLTHTKYSILEDRLCHLSLQNKKDKKVDNRQLASLDLVCQLSSLDP